MTFQPKIFRLKINKIQKSTVQTLGYLCSTTFQPKIFRLKIENISFKSADGQNRRRKLYPHFLDIFGCPKKCPFCPLRAVNLKYETQNLKNRVCDHNAHKTHF
jgi:uncharacterized protein (DUF2225 family)